MAGYDQTIVIRARYVPIALHFFAFLQKVGRRYKRPVKIKYRYQRRGHFYVTVDGGSGSIDALFQELVLNRGLYYYGCAIENRQEIITSVVLPIFRQLINERFSNPHSRFLRNHILGKYAQSDFVPTNIKNDFGYRFELLYRRWDLGQITNRDYVIDLDSLLHNFILTKIGHAAGAKSPKLNKILNILRKQFPIFDEARVAIDKMHKLRTGGLHRLNSPGTTEELDNHSMSLWSYFEYLDDFYESQKEHTICWKGKRFRRFRYGDPREALDPSTEKPMTDENGKPIDWPALCATRPCHDCAVLKGQLHVEGCDAEVCPRCGGQLISYDCGLPDG